MVGTSTLLLVDDEEQILTALQRTLRREKYRLLCASTPHRALQILEDESVDLILTDYKMPRMSGLQLLAHAKRLQPDAARMLISGWSVLQHGEMAALGVAAVVPKPWEEAELKNALRKALLSGLPSRRHASLRGAPNTRR